MIHGSPWERRFLRNAIFPGAPVDLFKPVATSSPANHLYAAKQAVQKRVDLNEAAVLSSAPKKIPIRKRRETSSSSEAPSDMPPSYSDTQQGVQINRGEFPFAGVSPQFTYTHFGPRLTPMPSPTAIAMRGMFLGAYSS